MRKLLLPFIVLSFFFTSTVSAQVGSGQSLSRGVLKKIKAAFADSDSVQEKVAINWPVQMQVPGIGRVNARFKSKRGRDVVPTKTVDGVELIDDSSILLLQGEYKSKWAQGPIAGSIFNHGSVAVLHVSFFTSDRHGHANHYDLSIPLTGEDQVVARTKRARNNKARCASPEISSSNAASARNPKVLVQKVLLSLDADTAWQNLHGGNANNFITTIVNNVITVYMTDTNTKVELVRQNLFANKNFGSNGGKIDDVLTAYQAFVPNQSYFGVADAYHLMTGFNLDALGLAFLDVICEAPAFSMGVNTFTTLSDTAVTLAHELAHNFNAQHDDNQASIMSVSFFEPALTFANPAVNAIQSRMAAHGNSCLGTMDVTPEDPTEFAQSYLTRIQAIIKNAKKNIPKGTGKKAKKKAKKVRKARKEIKSKLKELIALEPTSGAEIRTTLANFTAENLAQAKKLANQGSSKKLTRKKAKQKWKQLAKLVELLLS